MALQDGHTYMICNDLTHTFIALREKRNRRVFAMACGVDYHSPQQWTARKVDNAITGTMKWTFQNQRRYHDQDHFLSLQLEDPPPDKSYRLAGGILPCEFDIAPAGDGTGKCRILYNNDKAISLVTGEKIGARDVVLDLHADGPPIALQPRVEGHGAQIWFFHDTNRGYPSAMTLKNGEDYKIVNFETGTVLGVTGTVGNPVHGLVSKGGDLHKWTVTIETAHQDRYTLKNTATNHFLALEDAQNDQPGTALTIDREAKPIFTVRNVPGTRLYKIFLGSSAVNLADVNGAPDSLDGAVASLQVAMAQTWHFVQVTRRTY